ncbi:MAG TPA: hypothetical protein PKX69_10730, partial [Limnochordia bacterium]|nr:hypothetical protein [Limnochordia bacterium]
LAGDKLRIDAPAGALTPDLKEALRQHKPALVALFKERARPDVCRVCHSAKWWIGKHGGRVCGVCHPPADDSLVKQRLTAPASPALEPGTRAEKAQAWVVTVQDGRLVPVEPYEEAPAEIVEEWRCRIVPARIFPGWEYIWLERDLSCDRKQLRLIGARKQDRRKDHGQGD